MSKPKKLAKKTLAAIEVVREDSAALALPLSASVEDKELVDRAVTEIRAILDKTVSRGMEEIGRYLLDNFYEGRPELYASASHTKHVTLQLLVARCETMALPISKTFIANAVRMAAVTRGLPRTANFRKLPPSHRVELLRVGNPERVEQLASRALEGGLSVQKLRALVQKEHQKPAKGGRGRKPTPQVVRAFDLAVRALRDESSGRLMFHAEDVQQLTDEQRKRLRGLVQALERRLQEMKRLLD